MPLHCSILPLDVAVLSIPASLTIVEGDEGDRSTNHTCFTITLNQPRLRDVVFTITFNTMLSTASPGDDFYPLPENITITPDFNEEKYFLYLVVIGDDLVEDDEDIVYDVMALAEQDSVESVDSSNSLRVTIMDDDGETSNLATHIRVRWQSSHAHTYCSLYNTGLNYSLTCMGHYPAIFL